MQPIQFAPPSRNLRGVATSNELSLMVRQLLVAFGALDLPRATLVAVPALRLPWATMCNRVAVLQ